MYNPLNYHPKRPSEKRTGWNNPTPAEEAVFKGFPGVWRLVCFALLATVASINPVIGGAIVLAAQVGLSSQKVVLK